MLSGKVRGRRGQWRKVSSEIDIAEMEAIIGVTSGDDDASGLRPASASVCFRRIWALLKIILSMKNLICNNIMLAIEIENQVTNSMILITNTSVSSLLYNAILYFT